MTRQLKNKINDWITESGLLRIEAWARDGLSISEIAHNMGIAEGTLYEWKKKHTEINEAIKKGSIPADIIVENALYKRATGYKTVERKKIKLPDGTTRVEVVEKEIAPDTTAGIFWLANRCPDKWKRKQIDERYTETITPEDRQAVEDFLAEGEKAQQTSLEAYIKQNQMEPDGPDGGDEAGSGHV